MKKSVKIDYLKSKGIPVNSHLTNDMVNALFLKYFKDDMEKVVGPKQVPKCFGKLYNSWDVECQDCADQNDCKRETFTPSIKRGGVKIRSCYGSFSKRLSKCSRCEDQENCIDETVKEDFLTVKDELSRRENMVKKVSDKDVATEKVTSTKTPTSATRTVEVTRKKEKAEEKNQDATEKKLEKKVTKKESKVKRATSKDRLTLISDEIKKREKEGGKVDEKLVRKVIEDLAKEEKISYKPDSIDRTSSKYCKRYISGTLIR